jgi:hypothetical protein
MVGGLLNLIAVGPEDIILIGNPTKSFFTRVYAKYTNFGLQRFRIDFEGQRELQVSEPTSYLESDIFIESPNEMCRL